jgi:hypothetical protein
MVLILALALFVAMVVCWLVLPSSPNERATRPEAESAPAGARQLA